MPDGIVPSCRAPKGFDDSFFDIMTILSSFPEELVSLDHEEVELVGLRCS